MASFTTEILQSIYSFINSIMAIFTGIFIEILQRIANELSGIFTYWGSQLSAYGIWAPAMAIIGLALAFAGLYAIFTIFKAVELTEGS
uniref:hypothetical protein n=1 Tax=Thermoplasma acidophilum TaxID=2303 RepID=UPI0034E0C08D